MSGHLFFAVFLLVLVGSAAVTGWLGVRRERKGQ